MLRRFTPVIHKLDDTLARLNAARDVLFELRTPVYHAVLGPIAAALSAGSGVRVWYTSEYPDRIAPLLPEGAFLTHRQVEWRHFDLYANGDPWAAARLRRCSHRINFFHGVAGKYDLDRPSGLPMGFEYYDRVAFINRDRMQRYLDAGIVTSAQAVLLGYPKLDRLANGGWDGARIRKEAGLIDDRPTVLYAPTYSTASSLHIAGEWFFWPRSTDRSLPAFLASNHKRRLPQHIQVLHYGEAREVRKLFHDRGRWLRT